MARVRGEAGESITSWPRLESRSLEMCIPIIIHHKLGHSFIIPVLIEGVEAGEDNSQVVGPGGQVRRLDLHRHADVRVQALQGGG